MVRNQKLSKNFSLHEFLKSETAQRRQEWMEAQYRPPTDVINNLEYLVRTTLQPIRQGFDAPITVTSGYRSAPVNTAVGSSDRSQHRIGQAADLHVFIPDKNTSNACMEIKREVLLHTGKNVREDVNDDFYLFAWICLHLNELDVDQVLHEFGTGPGNPAWVHVSASRNKNKRQIAGLGAGVGTNFKSLTVKEALELGT